ncbi:RidA family protein [Sandaracinobacter neustonicus]|uniref:RidA family protein n=1 Tax=Sandaracinobacter neustonicus TaxID=1715348 RepID=A0A501XR74_9SPHN|nr:RidA family protein [Sandaracinobacter neustonicus]TPE62899.1 RidA family protein [Sandaracinobacter neustonicus]
MRLRNWVLVGVALMAAPALAETPEQRLAAKGFVLPEPVKPVATYVTSARTGNLLFLSGHGQCGEQANGKVGGNLSVDEGYASAQKVGLCMLATIKASVGELSKVKRFVRILGFVNSTPDFTQHPRVVNGFSDLMVVAFGEGGKAPRSAVGAPSLPMNIPVEIEAIVEVAD